MSDELVWKCTVCHKAKELAGDHLKDKTEIRTDCWPCAKKRLFKKVPAGSGAASPAQGSPDAGSPSPKKAAGFGFDLSPPSATPAPAAAAAANPFTKPPTAAAAPPATAAAFTFGAKPAAGAGAPAAGVPAFTFGQTVPASAAAAAPTGSGASTTPSFTFGSISPQAAQQGAPGYAATFSFGATPATTQAQTFKKSGTSPGLKPAFAVDIPEGLQKLPTNTKNSPTITFGSSSANAAVPRLESVLSPPNTGNTSQWRCAVCMKMKELVGDHLKGKTKVRSDCWPCAKKREFILDAPLPTQPPVTPGGMGDRAPSVSSSAGGTASTAAWSGFKAPTLPQVLNPKEAPTHYLRVPECKANFVRDGQLLGAMVRLTAQLGARSPRHTVAENATVLHWSSVADASASKNDLEAVGERLVFGAAVCRLVPGCQAIFCPDETTHAALCAWTSMAGMDNVVVYGPAQDITTQRTVAGEVVEGYSGRTVSATHAQCLEAVRLVYDSTGEVTTAAGATGFAIWAQSGCRDDSTPRDTVVIVGDAVPWSALASTVATVPTF